MKQKRLRRVVISVILSAVLVSQNAWAVLANPQEEETAPREEEIPVIREAELLEENPEEAEEVMLPADIDGDGQTEDAEPEETGKEDTEEKEVPSSGASHEQKENGLHHHDAACDYREAAAEVPCDHECKDMDGDGKKEHCKECAYRPAEEAVPCWYESAKQKEEEEKRKQEEEKLLQEQTEIPKLSEDGAEEQKEPDPKPDTDGKENITQKEDEQEKTEPEKTEEETDASIEEAAEKPDKAEPEISETDNEADTGSEELGSNEPAYTVNIPAQVVVDETSSFTIETKKMQPEMGGSLIVTVEGTQSKDGRNFALYCGESSWEYQLELSGTYLTPLQNQTRLMGEEETRSVNIIPAFSNPVRAGEYKGVLMFHVTYEE